MASKISLHDLLNILLGMQGTFILQNAHGSMELRGSDLYAHPYNEWLTIYHATPRNPESQSHLHLRWQTFGSAMIVHREGDTPYLAFFATPDAHGEPLLLWYFPSFYDWQGGKTAIPANIARYEAFVQQYGTSLQFVHAHA